MSLFAKAVERKRVESEGESGKGEGKVEGSGGKQEGEKKEGT